VTSDRDARANSFGPAADVYERGRPPYPAEALDWLLPAGNPRVIDLGAGTGKLTRQIHDRGLTVTAVDPSPGMLAELARAVPGVTAVEGRAEQIPLPDGCADAVVAAQAWHWVDPAQAVPEVARVLTPGGRLGLVWNLRDRRSDWIRRLEEIMGTRSTPPVEPLGKPFSSPAYAEFAWSHTIGPERLIDLVASRSDISLLPADERAAVLGEVRKLAATHPSLVGRTEFPMPYVTHCIRADRSH
jgi:SAM-dependent methyltransferase